MHLGLRGVDLHLSAKVVGRFKFTTVVRGVMREISLVPTVVPVVEDEPENIENSLISFELNLF